MRCSPSSHEVCRETFSIRSLILFSRLPLDVCGIHGREGHDFFVRVFNFNLCFIVEMNKKLSSVGVRQMIKGGNRNSSSFDLCPLPLLLFPSFVRTLINWRSVAQLESSSRCALELSSQGGNDQKERREDACHRVSRMGNPPLSWKHVNGSYKWMMIHQLYLLTIFFFHSSLSSLPLFAE